MYGGGFATIPAYLRDLFGTMQVGAIHGRLITAWSMAAVLGPQLVNYVSTYQIEHGVPAGRGLQLDDVPDGRPAAGRPGLQPAGAAGRRPLPSRAGEDLMPEKTTSPLVIALAWLVVLIPLGWGVYQSVVKSLPLFGMPH